MNRTAMRTFSAMAAVVVICAATVANAAIITQWTFEDGTAGNPPSGTGTSITGISPSTGTGTAGGTHAVSTTWDNPVGNGSVESFSSNNWGIGGYYQFSSASTGYKNIQLSFDAAGSNTGPRDFKVQYSTDGSTFIDSGDTYTVLANAAPNTPWSAGTYQSVFTHTFDLSAITALNEQAVLAFRLVNTSTTAINSGSPVAAGGTSRLDNVTISGLAVPEPASAMFVLLAVTGMGVTQLRRRR